MLAAERTRRSGPHARAERLDATPGVRQGGCSRVAGCTTREHRAGPHPLPGARSGPYGAVTAPELASTWPDLSSAWTSKTESVLETLIFVSRPLHG